MIMLIDANGREINIARGKVLNENGKIGTDSVVSVLISDDLPEIHEALERGGISLVWGQNGEYRADTLDHYVESSDSVPALNPRQIIVHFPKNGRFEE